MRLPRWDELNEKQRDVLDHPLDQSLFVAGPPGSGKTVLAVGRMQALARNGRSVRLLTLNRPLRRLNSLLGEEAPHCAKTMHSFVFRDYGDRTGLPPPNRPASSYDYDWSTMIDTLERYPNTSSRYDHLVVDEGQDLPPGFFQYVARYASNRLSVFADEEQALSRQRTKLKQIKQAAGLQDPVILWENFRNTPEVAALANHFHRGRLPVTKVRRSSLASKPHLIWSPSLEATVDRIHNWQDGRGGRTGVIAVQNDTAREVCRELQRRLPFSRVDMYDSEEKNENGIDLLAEGVTIFNKESVKGQEFDAVFVLELQRLIPCSGPGMYRTMYMLCSRARDHLFLLYGPLPLSAPALAALPGPEILERS